jgi:hypothetical protein
LDAILASGVYSTNYSNEETNYKQTTHEKTDLISVPRNVLRMRRIVKRRRRNKYFKAVKAHHKAPILDASFL